MPDTKSKARKGHYRILKHYDTGELEHIVLNLIKDYGYEPVGSLVVFEEGLLRPSFWDLLFRRKIQMFAQTMYLATELKYLGSDPEILKYSK
tara:strand:+ start:1300 stop:1575 length:276 start_codon:yes stop_codon:yes gene_type:complete